MDFRRILPEIRCRSCLSPGSEPTPRGGFSLLAPVCLTGYAPFLSCAPKPLSTRLLRSAQAHQVAEYAIRRLLHPRLDRDRSERTHQIRMEQDRKSTRLNSSHANISYAVFC